jgi:peptide methionine sulfoxide reductase MsrB
MTQWEYRSNFLESDGEYMKGTPPCVYCQEKIFNQCTQVHSYCEWYNHYVMIKIKRNAKVMVQDGD